MDVPRLLPDEMWEMILAYLAPCEEFGAALVCRFFYKTLARRRNRRGELQWRTWSGAFVNTVPRLTWAREHGYEWGATTCGWAAYKGHLSTLEWAVQNGCPIERIVCRYAAGGGHLPVIEWLHGKRDTLDTWDPTVLGYAGVGGHTHVLQWALDHEIPIDQEVWSIAAIHAQIPCLRWLHEHGVAGMDKTTTEYAALGGHADVLDWLHSAGCPLGSKICTYAAIGGYLPVLKWARAHGGCGWDRHTCAQLAARGKEVLAWILEQPE
jgi:hypothetical protein